MTQCMESSNSTHPYEENRGNTEKAEGYEERDNGEEKGEHRGGIAPDCTFSLPFFKYCIYLICASHYIL